MEENVENVVEETTPETVETVEETKFNSANDDSVIKVDLNKPPTPKEEIKNETEEKTEVAENNADNEGVAPVDADTTTAEKQEEVQPEEQTQETPVLEEITEEEVQEQTEELTEQVEEAVAEAQETGQAIPENLQKVVDFMEETGGTLEDYVRLNQDFSSYDDMTVLREYYRQTKSHLTDDEISFLIEDSFSYDEEEDEVREIKKKKIALKEQVANAKSHLDGQKSKYYEEVKAGSRLTPEQQKAVNFFNRYNKESEETQKIAEKQTNTFKLKTQQVFNDKFKGFEYNVGDKRYRFNVKNANEVKETQGDINNFVKKFLNENNEMSDAKGYHKSLFTAMNPDAIANHFYEQGKADAMKDSVAKAKNVSMDPRQSFSNDNTSGPKVRVLSNDSPNFKFKIKNK
ncbi:hypothetical protein [uncultured Mediterranean phage]|nr:hypothetical protein [uncultured Mediterranean phage]